MLTLGGNSGRSREDGLKRIANVWLINLLPQSTGGCGIGKEDRSPSLSHDNSLVILGLSF